MRLPLFPRRQPCPCGSTKKFKDCCEGSVDINADQVRAAERAEPGTIAAMLKALDEIA